MSKSKDRGHREARKPQQEVPELPRALGRLSMPRKTNRSAAKYIAETGWFWDRRRVARRLKRERLRRQHDRATDPRRQHLSKTDRKQLLAAAPRWRCDTKTQTLHANELTVAVLEELIDAISRFGEKPVTLRVADVSAREAWRLRGYLAEGSAVIPVDSRWPHPVFV